MKPPHNCVYCFYDETTVEGVPEPSRVSRASRAWPLAWPLPSGPLGWQRLRGQRRAVRASARSADAEHR